MSIFREDALKWWRSLNINEKIRIIDLWKNNTEEGKRCLFTSDMIAASSSTIEKIYRWQQSF